MISGGASQTLRFDKRKAGGGANIKKRSGGKIAIVLLEGASPGKKDGTMQEGPFERKQSRGARTNSVIGRGGSFYLGGKKKGPVKSSFGGGIEKNIPS